MEHSENTYRNESLGFSISKPETWAFLPTQWVANIKNRVNHTSEEYQELLHQAQVPFVYFQFDHQEADFAYPTVQATCRPIKPVNKKDRKFMLGQQILTLTDNFEDFSLIESTHNGFISQCPANISKFRFSIQNVEGTKFSCLARSYTIFVRHLAFTIGLSGPSNGPYVCNEEFDGILKSIIIS